MEYAVTSLQEANFTILSRLSYFIKSKIYPFAILFSYDIVNDNNKGLLHFYFATALAHYNYKNVVARDFILKVVGLITEYNPFHNGHLYHMKQAIARTNADFCIVVMSGNFVQRGAPAIIDKYSRTQMALEAGADLVLELPMPFACASAEIFAHAAVALLDSLGIVTHLCFGSEHNDKDLLTVLASIFCEEPPVYRAALQASLKNGNSFPKARTDAVLSYFKHISASKDFEQFSHIETKQLEAILSSPNNILGIEYLKALQRLSSSICAVPIHRILSGYHSAQIQDKISSATAIRQILETATDLSKQSEDYHLLFKTVPMSVLEKLSTDYQVQTPIVSNDFSSILNYCLLTKSEYYQYAEWTDELSNRVLRIQPACYSFNEWAMQLKSKNITHSRICRSLIHLITNVSKEDMLQYKQQNYCLYARILGFRMESTPLLSSLKKQCRIPIITKAANAKTILNPIAMHLFEQELFASRLYNQIVFQKFNTVLPDEYRANIIRL